MRILHFSMALGFLIWSIASAARAEIISIDFTEGFVGAAGQNRNKVENISLFSTLGLQRARLYQNSENGLFGGVSGNDYAGTLSLYTAEGELVSIDGLISWQDTSTGEIQAFGFYPDEGTPQLTFPTPQGSYTISNASNFGLKLVDATLTYQDGATVSGNNAMSTLLDKLNSYLETVVINAPVITGPAGTAGDTAISLSLMEGGTQIGLFSSDKTVSWQVSGGADASLVTIDAISGLASFLSAPDYGAPIDTGLDNTYSFDVLAVDQDGYATAQSVTVTILETGSALIQNALSVALAGDPSVGFLCDSDPIDPLMENAAPGACVEYTLTTHSDPAGATVTGYTVGHDMPPDLTFVTISYVDGFDSAVFTGARIEATIDTFPPGATATLKARALIN